MILRNLNILVFSDARDLSETAQAAAVDPRLSRSRIDVRKGSTLEAAEWLAANRSPDVLVVRETMEGDAWPRLERLAENVEPACRVIVVGQKDSIALYRELTSRGIADYIGGAIGTHDFILAVTRLFDAEGALPKGKLVVTMSASGGAGGSTLAAILASELSKRYGDGLLLDLDFNMGTSALALGMEIRDSVADAAANKGLDASMLERFVVRQGGLGVLSTNGSLRIANSFDGESIERLVQTARGLAKVVVADLPKGWSENHYRLLALADDIAVVTVPELASFRNARMIVDDTVARRSDAPRPKIVMNKAGLAKGKEYTAIDLKEVLGAAPTAIVPWDPTPLMAAIAHGKTIVDAGGRAIPAFKSAAKYFLQTKESRAAKETPAASGFTFKSLFAKHA